MKFLRLRKGSTSDPWAFEFWTEAGGTEDCRGVEENDLASSLGEKGCPLLNSGYSGAEALAKHKGLRGLRQ
jgi:hypothetical protein